MAIYTVKAPDGRTVKLSGDTPPTDSDLDEIFSKLPASKEKKEEVGGSAENKKLQEELTKENEEVEARRNSSMLESAGAGAGSAVTGLATLGTMGVNKLADILKPVLDEAVPEAAEYLPTTEKSSGFNAKLANINEKLEQTAGANPVTAALASAGLQYLSGGGGTAGVTENLAKGAFKEAGKAAVRPALTNVAIGGGIRAATGGDATNVKDVMADALVGGLTGGKSKLAASTGPTMGSALEKVGAVTKEAGEKASASPLVEKVVGAVKRPFARAAITKEAEKATKQYGDEVAEKISQTVDTPEAKASVKKTVQEAHANGVLPEHTAVIEDMTPDERAIASKMTDQAEKWKRTRKHDDDPFRVGGEEFMKRINDLDKVTNDIGKLQGEAVANIPEVNVRTSQADALAAMQAVPGFEGLSIDKKGKLDFSDTRFMSELSKSKKNVIQKYFDASKGKNAKQLDLLRKEMFEDLGGKRKARVELNESQEKLMDAIRKGYADTIERVSPEYKALNQQYAESVTPLREMMKFFKNVKDMPEDVRELQAGTLMRRLTSHAQSNAELRGILGSMEAVLAKNGKKYDTRIDKLQDYMNVLNLYYQLDKPTSIGGIIRSSTGNELPIGKLETVGAALKAVGKKAIGDTSITPAVQQQNLKNVIKAVQGKKVTVASPVKAMVPPTTSTSTASAVPTKSQVGQAVPKTTTAKSKGALAGIKRAAKRKKSNKE